MKRGSDAIEISELGPTEHEAWLRLRGLLWPEEPKEDLEDGRRWILGDPERNAVFVARLRHGELVGFVEAALRDWAEGCGSRPVGYVEGWYVTPEHRRRGVGRRLVEAAEQWARSRGCTEMGSDAELSNTLSHRAHAALGYAEVERVVAFAKRLEP
jgi:aminoglycoside 6'-N-acetyltransferase I